MRSQLDAEMEGPGRRDGRLRRYGIPVAAAAAVMAAAIGGYALLGGGNRSDFAPAGGPDTASSKPAPTATSTATPTQPPKPKPKPVPTQTTPPPKPELKPGQAYRKCIQLVRDHGVLMGEPVKGLSGKVIVSDSKSTTVVVANRTNAYTCNVRPDDAVSNPRPLDSAVSEETFAVANNVTRNVIPDDPGDYTWGGGALPDGVTSVTYGFPDGHEERATIRDGFWVMQYFSPGPFDGGPDGDPITVTLDGPGGQRELTLEWGTHTCNQVSHGC